MFEFPFVEEAAENKKGVELFDYLQVRLPRLVKHATTLLRAGWHVDLTVRGFLFEPPDMVMAEVGKAWDQNAALEGHLRNLGIEDQFEFFPARTLAEIGEVACKLFDRVWYERKLVMPNSPQYDRAEMTREHPDIVQGMLRNMQRIDQEGLEVEFSYENDFEWGMINGMFSAIGWVLGDDWDNLDT